MNKELYYYRIQYQEFVHEKLLEIVDMLKPITLVIDDIPDSNNIFTTYINDNYYYTPSLRLYSRKDYFPRNGYIYKDYDTLGYYDYHYYEYNGETKKENSVQVDKKKLQSFLPILAISKFDNNELDGEIIKINYNGKSILILKEKPIRTKKAVTTK